MSFLNSDQFPNDSNKTCEVLMAVLKYCQEQLGKLPKKLNVQSDNCGKERLHKRKLNYLGKQPNPPAHCYIYFLNITFLLDL